MSTQSDVGRQSKIVAIGIIVMIAVLGYIAATYFADSSRKQSQISAVQTQGRGTPTKESEQYSQVLDKYNRTKADDAEQKGQSYLSVLSSRTNNVSDQPRVRRRPSLKRSRSSTISSRPSNRTRSRISSVRRKSATRCRG